MGLSLSNTPAPLWVCESPTETGVSTQPALYREE